MNIVLDTNIYIAAFLSRGLSSDILKYGERNQVKIYSSGVILNEVKTRLIDKLKLNENYVNSYIRHLGKSVNLVVPTQKLEVVKADPDDDKILECAVEADADLIVSIDKHLLKIKSYGKIGIVHPKTLTWILPKILEGN